MIVKTARGISLLNLSCYNQSTSPKWFCMGVCYENKTLPVNESCVSLTNMFSCASNGATSLASNTRTCFSEEPLDLSKISKHFVLNINYCDSAMRVG